MAASEDSFVFPNRHDGCECLICKNVPVNRAPVFDLYRVVKVDYYGNKYPLTDDEYKVLETKHSRVADWTVKDVTQTSWHKTCAKLLKPLMSDRKRSFFFANPVDPIALNIPDYPKVVKHFMDFGTIQKKLTDQARADKYVSPEDFVSDVRQVFRNCYLYNKNTTHVWHAAKVLSEKFEREIKKLQGYVGI